MSQAPSITVKNVTIDPSGGNAVEVTEAHGVVIRDCTIIPHKGDGQAIVTEVDPAARHR